MNLDCFCSPEQSYPSFSRMLRKIKQWSIVSTSVLLLRFNAPQVRSTKNATTKCHQVVVACCWYDSESNESTLSRHLSFCKCFALVLRTVWGFVKGARATPIAKRVARRSMEKKPDPKAGKPAEHGRTRPLQNAQGRAMCSLLFACMRFSGSHRGRERERIKKERRKESK